MKYQCVPRYRAVLNNPLLVASKFVQPLYTTLQFVQVSWLLTERNEIQFKR